MGSRQGWAAGDGSGCELMIQRKMRMEDNTLVESSFSATHAGLQRGAYHRESLAPGFVRPALASDHARGTQRNEWMESEASGEPKEFLKVGD